MQIKDLVQSPYFTPVRGAHIYPLRCFADERPASGFPYTKVVDKIVVRDMDILVSLGGALCGYQHDTENENAKISESINMLLCEMALNGVVSEPTSAAQIQGGKFVRNHIVLWGGPSGKLFFPERHVGVTTLLDSQSGYYWPPNVWFTPISPGIFDKVREQPLAEALHGISNSAPTLLTAAYYSFARNNVAESIALSWFLTEQILNAWWDELVRSVKDNKRRKRLNDERTYTASVRAEVLLLAGCITEELYESLQAARRHRNELAHKLAIGTEGARECVRAMRRAVEHLCGRQVAAEPQVSAGWSGFGAPLGPG